MKKDIHPKVNIDCAVTCVCGNKFTTISTQPSLQVDICSACHPFFTGTQKLIDTEGRIDKFNKKLAQTTQKKETAASKVKVAKVEAVKPQRANLKDILKQLKDDEKVKAEAPTPETPNQQ